MSPAAPLAVYASSSLKSLGRCASLRALAVRILRCTFDRFSAARGARSRAGLVALACASDVHPHRLEELEAASFPGVETHLRTVQLVSGINKTSC